MIKNITTHAPNELIEWLLYKDFLMTKLKNLCEKVTLQVISQDWIKKSWWEKHHLNISTEFLCREIIMKGDENICWYAKTLLPKTTYDNYLELFARLDKEPLGNLLFDPANNIKRENFKYYPINSDYLEYHFLDKVGLSNLDDILWMRLSAFSFPSNDVFYLAEIFLPDLYQVIKEHKSDAQ